MHISYCGEWESAPLTPAWFKGQLCMERAQAMFWCVWSGLVFSPVNKPQAAPKSRSLLTSRVRPPWPHLSTSAESYSPWTGLKPALPPKN